MIYKLHKNGSYNIHTIKTDRFKTIKMQIVFHNNIDASNLSSRVFLFETLLEASLNYPNKRLINLKLEELYNAVLYVVNNKVGNLTLNTICMEFLNPKYTNNDYLEEAIKLPFELIFNPLIKDLEFDEGIIETIRNRLISDLLSIKERPQEYAINEAIKKMDDKSISSLNILGTKSELESINKTNLVESYKNVLNHDYVDIYIIGDIDTSKVIDIINRYASFKTIKNHELVKFIDNKKRIKRNIITEDSKYNQTQLVYVLNTFDLNEFERKYSMQLYNMILGGGSLETKLYQNLRGKASLCYNVHSVYNKYDNLLIIITSIDKNNINKAINIIDKTIEEMKNNITEVELEHAVNSVISSINMSEDNPSRIIDNYVFHNTLELDLMDERIKKYNMVTVQDIKKMAKHIKQNTVYILKGDDDGKN